MTMASHISPSQACEQIVQQVKGSFLNFVLNETPYSINLSIKKRFQQHFTVQSSNSSPLKTSRSAQGDPESEEKIETLKVESEALRVRAEKAEKQNVTLKNTVEVLEEKFKKAEEIMYKELKETKISLDNSFEDEKVLKGVLKKQIGEISQHKSEISSMSKLLKSKAKEIHNLETKIENQNDTIKNLKHANADFKSDKKKLEKKVKESIRLESNRSSLKCSECDKSSEKNKIAGHVRTSHVRENVTLNTDPLIATTDTENETNTPTKESTMNEAEPPATPVDERKNDEGVTEGPKTFKCNECFKDLTSEFMLEIHMKFYHDSMVCFPCDLCDKKFQEFSQMITHIKTCHSKLPIEDTNANKDPNSEETDATFSISTTNPTTMMDSLISTPNSNTKDLNSNTDV